MTDETEPDSSNAEPGHTGFYDHLTDETLLGLTAEALTRLGGPAVDRVEPAGTGRYDFLVILKIGYGPKHAIDVADRLGAHPNVTVDRELIADGGQPLSVAVRIV